MPANDAFLVYTGKEIGRHRDAVGSGPEPDGIPRSGKRSTPSPLVSLHVPLPESQRRRYVVGRTDAEEATNESPP